MVDAVVRRAVARRMREVGKMEDGILPATGGLAAGVTAHTRGRAR